MVLTGGAAAMQGAAELASDVFGTGVRVGIPSENIGGLVDSVEAPRFATVVGSGAVRGEPHGARRGGRERATRIELGGGGMEKIVAQIKFWLQDFF